MVVLERCKDILSNDRASLSEKSKAYETMGDISAKMGQFDEARKYYTLSSYASPFNEELYRKRLSLIQRNTLPRIALSVVISSYYRFSSLVRTVENVRANTFFPHQIIVVVDKCDDGTVEYVREQHGKNSFVGLVNERHQGNVASLIKGMCQSQGNYIALLGDDIRLMPGWDLEVVLTIENDPQAGCGVPLILDPDGDIDSAGKFNEFCSPKFEWIGRLKQFRTDYACGKNMLNFPELHHPRECDYGVAPVLKRKCLEQIGRVDGAYRHYFFDPDLGYTLQEHGWKNIYCPTSVMVHNQRQSESDDKERNQKAAPEYYYFVHKWGLHLP